MKKVFLLAMALVLMSFSANAKSGTVSPYFVVRGGGSAMNVSHLPEEKDTIALISAAVGLKDNRFFRMELEKTFRAKARFGYDTTGTNPVRGKSYSVMVNAYFDFPTRSPFTPFFGGGIGTATNYIRVGNNEKSNTDFSYAFAGGLLINGPAFLDFELGYRFVGLGTANYGNDTVHCKTNEFYGGLMFTF